jgi:lipoprotein-anchoring transpeptidase ErfK/SrfK
LAALAVPLLLSGCGTGAHPLVDRSPVGFTPTSHEPTTAGPSAEPTQDGAAVAQISTSPSTGTPLNPTTPITVTVSGGTLEAVQLTNPEGKAVKGTMAADHSSWTTAEVLGYSKKYTLSATAQNAAGVRTVSDATYTTLTPDNLTMPYLNTTGGQALQDGATYGVGIVPVVRFDEPIADKKAAEKALVVTTTPHVDGVWNWVSDREAHWRPERFFNSGTKVTVSANVYGVEVGPGLYGQADKSVSFTIGQKRVAIADDKTHQVSVYWDDKLVRTMPTSMGRGGYVTGVGGQQISLWTMPGFYTVIGHANPVLMDSSTYGLPVTATSGYREYIYWATQISTDGIYLHELTSTIWAQGNTDVSHGCLNLNTDNAVWFYKNSQIGDVVKVEHTGGPGIEVWQNGDWSVPWATWVKGSALA